MPFEQALAALTKPVVLIAGRQRDKGFKSPSVARSLVKDKVKSAASVSGEKMAREHQSAHGTAQHQLRDRSFVCRRGRTRARPSPGRGDVVLFFPSHRPSTCFKATPTAATNSARWCKHCRNEDDKNPAFFQKKEIPGRDGASSGVGCICRNGLLWHSRAQHEVVPRALLVCCFCMSLRCRQLLR